jgi:hypothetical protein
MVKHRPMFKRAHDTKVADLASFLPAKGAERVSVVALEQAFDACDALRDALARRIGPGPG